MSRLVLRRGTVSSVQRPGPVCELTVDCESAGVRRAVSYDELTGPVAVGDEVVLNTQAVDLGLSSGGADIVHVNLTRGLAATSTGDAHVMKLNYTSLQHAVEPLEQSAPALGQALGAPVCVLALHGQLACVVWQAKQRQQHARIGYIQTEGGAIVGSLSRVVAELLDRELLCGHVTAGAAFAGKHEALTVTGGLHAALTTLGWDAAICGPGPGLVGSGSELGHGGMAALEAAHTAACLGCQAIVVPRMSSGEERERHRGLSHHTRTVLALLLRSVTVALPARAVASVPDRHAVIRGGADIEGYARSGLSNTTMGRSIAADGLFFESALAGGDVLGGELDGV